MYHDPKTYSEAISKPDDDKWLTTMKEEISSLSKKKKHMDSSSKPKGKKILD